MSGGEVTGESASDLRALVPDVETLARALAEVDHLVDEGLATSMSLSLRRAHRRRPARQRARRPLRVLKPASGGPAPPRSWPARASA
jgi:hypothetical protein